MEVESGFRVRRFRVCVWCDGDFVEFFGASCVCSYRINPGTVRCRERSKFGSEVTTSTLTGLGFYPSEIFLVTGGVELTDDGVYHI